MISKRSLNNAADFTRFKSKYRLVKGGYH
ncbi:uncharacterized protein METZ01_LOCUS498252, partial [marine metagenome]